MPNLRKINAKSTVLMPNLLSLLNARQYFNAKLNGIWQWLFGSWQAWIHSHVFCLLRQSVRPSQDLSLWNKSLLFVNIYMHIMVAALMVWLQEYKRNCVCLVISICQLIWQWLLELFDMYVCIWHKQVIENYSVRECLTMSTWKKYHNVQQFTLN